MLLHLAVVLVCCSGLLGSEMVTGPLATDEAHQVLRRAAENAELAPVSADPTKNQTRSNQTIFFEIRDDTTKEIVARMQVNKESFLVNLVKTKNTSDLIHFEMDGRRVKSYGNYSFNKTEPKISATKVEKSTKDGNSTKVCICVVLSV